MKLSKIIHIISVVVGVVGVVIFLAVVFGGGDYSVFGVTTVHALLCVSILFLIAIWTQIATIHHMMLEKKKEVI